MRPSAFAGMSHCFPHYPEICWSLRTASGLCICGFEGYSGINSSCQPQTVSLCLPHAVNRHSCGLGIGCPEGVISWAGAPCTAVCSVCTALPALVPRRGLRVEPGAHVCRHAAPASPARVSPWRAIHTDSTHFFENPGCSCKADSIPFKEPLLDML